MSTESKALSGTPLSISTVTASGQGPLAEAKRLESEGKLTEAMNLLSSWSSKSPLAERSLQDLERRVTAEHARILIPLFEQIAQIQKVDSGNTQAVLKRLRAAVEGGEGDLATAFASLSAADRKTLEHSLGAANLRQLKSIASETRPEQFWGDLYRMGLDQKNTFEPKQVLFGQLLFSFITAQESGVPAEIRNQSQRELNALTGHGDLGTTLENLSGNFVHQVTDLKMIAPMVLATPVFHATRFGALRLLSNSASETLLTRGFGANALASTAGFLGETTFFSLSSRGLAHAIDGPVAWDAKSVGQDWLTAAMTLGLLKSVGFAGRRGGMWFKGLDEAEMSLWSKADHRAMFWTGQASGYLGLVGAHKMEEMLGLRTPTPGSHLLLDALSTHLALGLGAHLGRSAMGPRFAALEQRLNHEAGTLYKVSQLSRARRGGLSPYEYLKKTLAESFTLPGGGFPPGLQPAAVGAYGAMMTGPRDELGIRDRLPSHIAAMVSDGPQGSGESQPPAGAGQRFTSSMPPKPLEGKYIVIGNRGEPAVRAVKTARELGATPVVYVSEADRNALHASLDGVLPVYLKGNTSNETYNNVDARLEGLSKLMEQKGIDPEQVVTWEGWGFKSEDAGLFTRHEELGFGIAGAPSRSHELMGDKVSARRVAIEAGASVVPGSEEISSLEAGQEFAESIGFPVIIKGKDTGGGKGIRVAMTPEEFPEAFAAARREAESTSGSAAVFVEKFIPRMRHIEVQVVADGKGKFVIAGVRECSLQRNKQKVIEEDVSTYLDGEILDQAKDIATKLMSHPELKGSEDSPGYKGPGTIEMIWDVSDNKLYFMEMNTRLQVEHTVTEMVTGKNLLKAQLELGAGLPLSFTEVQPKGHAIEVRITSEDPYDNFRPSTGRILHYREPESHKTDRIIVRVDSGVEGNLEISEHYDSMIAKLVVWGQTRADAIEGLQRALTEFEILGVKTNIPFLKALVGTPEFQEGRWGDTRFIEEVFLKSDAGKPVYKDQQEAIITAAVQTYLMRKKALVKSRDHILNGSEFKSQVELEFNGQKYDTEVYEIAPNQFMVRVGDSSAEVGVRPSNKFLYNLEIDGQMRRSLIKAEKGSREVLIDNVSYPIKVHGEGDLGPGNVVAQMPGKVVAVKVKPGDHVKAGDPVVVIEAMKMENSILADISGVVKAVEVAENGQVAAGQKMVVIEGAEEVVTEGTAEIQVPVGFDRAPSLLGRVVASDKKPSFQDRRQIMDYATRFFDGYGAPAELLSQALAKIKPQGLMESSSVERRVSRVAQAVKFASPYVDFNKDLGNWLQGLVDRFIAVETVFHPQYQQELAHFLKSGEVESGPFADALKRALKLHGVESTDPSTELDEAVFRLHQSHEQLAKKAEILGQLLPWIPEFKMTELDSSLKALQALSLEGLPVTFGTDVATNRQLLASSAPEPQTGSTLEQAFAGLLRQAQSPDAKTQAEFFNRGHEVIPFLLDQVKQSRDMSRRNLALGLLQNFHYGNRHGYNRSQWLGSGVLTQFVPYPGTGEKPVKVLSLPLLGSTQETSLEATLDHAIGNLQRSRMVALEPVQPQPAWMGLARSLVPKRLLQVVDQLMPGPVVTPQFFRTASEISAVEIVLPEAPSAAALRQMEQTIVEKVRDQNIDRVTLVIPQSDGMPDYRTYFQNPASGKYEENVILRNIHPAHARDLQLDRWTPHFDLTRRDFGLFDHVHAYRAVEKNPENPKARDQRHFVIGEHRGALSYEKFDGGKVKDRLLQDFKKFQTDPDYHLDGESRMIWSWLPYALREVGELSSSFDPFSIGVLKASPKELIHRFELTEAKLEKVAGYYEGKVKTIPEVEKVARETSLVMQRLQQENGREGPLPANADIYIHEPVEMTDAEIKLMAFRLTPGFMGQRIEKTTVHFNRRVGSLVRPFIAEVKIPGQTRFEVTIKPGLDVPPPHQPRSELDRKRVIQQGRGKQYVYDRVALFSDVLQDFYPKGNIPPDAIRIQEMVLNPEGKLVSTEREIGQNNIGKVAFKVSFKIPKGSDSQDMIRREFMVIADDYTFMAGSQGTKEGLLYKAVSVYAVEHGLPKLYLAESSGARIGFAKEVKPFIHMDPETGALYVLPQDLETPVGKKQRPLRSLIQVGAAYEASVSQDGKTVQESRVPVVAIIGEGEINTESLNASGLSGESESRARAHVPTATITFGTTIGISTYLARLSEFVVMVENSFLGLTGRNAINNTFGSKYENELEVAGPKIMTQNGVAYKVVKGERDALKSYLQWLSYQPVKVGAPVPRLETHDPIDRDVGPQVQALIPGKGQKYDTKKLDEIIFDQGSVWYVQDDGDPMYGRYVNTGFATLGGIPVGILSMEMNPKMKPGEKQVYPGGLDPQSSEKVAQHIRNVNRMGLPLIFNSSITGFMPRHNDHLEGVIPGGARILDALREFDQAAVMWIPPHGFLYGGAWVVIDKNINPYVTMVADNSAQMGILGSQAANDLPLVARTRTSPDEYKKTKLMLDAQNTPQRALAVGSIHEVIEDTGKTRSELHRLLTQKMDYVEGRKQAIAFRDAALGQVASLFSFLDIHYDIQGDNVVIQVGSSTHQIPLSQAHEGLRHYLGGLSNFDLLNAVLVPRPEGDKE